MAELVTEVRRDSFAWVALLFFVQSFIHPSTCHTQGKATSVNIDAFSPSRFFSAKTRRGKKMKDQEVGEQW